MSPQSDPVHTSGHDTEVVELDLEANEASGLLSVADPGLLSANGWDFAFWTVLDEPSVERALGLIGHRDGSPIGEGWETLVVHAHQHDSSAIEAEDAEAIGRWSGWIYVFGSHFGDKTGPLSPAEAFVARFREEDVNFESDGGATVELFLAERDFTLHRLANDAMTAHSDKLAPRPDGRAGGAAAFLASSDPSRWDVQPGDVAINIEGATFTDDGTLLLGLRNPVTSAGDPLVVAISRLDAMFDDGVDPQGAGSWIIDGIGTSTRPRGIRDLEFREGALHFVAGHVDRAVLVDGASADAVWSSHWVVDPFPIEGEASARQIREFTGLQRVEGMAFAPDGRLFYVSDEDDRVVTRFVAGAPV